MLRYVVLVISLLTLLSVYIYKNNFDNYELYLWESDEYTAVGKKELTQFYFNEHKKNATVALNDSIEQSKQRGGWQSIFNEKARDTDEDSIWPHANKIIHNNVSTFKISVDEIKPQLALIAKVESNNIELLSSPAKTRVLSINVAPGDTIKKGEPLYLLNNNEYELQLNQKLNALNQSQLNLNIANNELVNNQSILEDLDSDLKNELRLYNEGLSNLKRVNEIKNEIQKMELNISVNNENVLLKKSINQAELNQYENLLDKNNDYHALAPFDAEILDVYVAKNQLLAVGENIIKLIKTDSKIITSHISMNTKQKINSNQINEDYILKNNDKIKLKNKTISREINNGLIDIKFEVEQNNTLTLGENVELIVELDSVLGALVPKESIYENKYIYIMHGDEIFKEEVLLKGYRKIDDKEWAIVFSDDLTTNDEVLVTRLVQPYDGAKVQNVRVNESTEQTDDE